MEISQTALQEQKLLLTSQMRQSMEILHMSSLDLNEFIQQQSLDNPFIELQHANDIPSTRHAGGSEQDWWLNADLSSEATLESVLLEQVTYMKLSPDVLILCKWIIGNLDEKGYLLHSIDEISALKGASLRQVSEAVSVIQGLEPYGVGASTLAECLLLQLQHQEQEQEDDQLVMSLVRDDLLSIAEGRLRQLAEKYGTEVANIKAAIVKISSLNPKPGALYVREKPQYILPDLQLIEVAGKYELSLESGGLPAITINDSYMSLMEQKASKDVHRYLKKNWQAAKELMDSIERRKATLLKTAGAIFELQAEFCKKGSSSIRPMSMKQIAETLQVHESTISRTVNHKYIRTPWGLFELKHFFSSSIKHADGTTVSAIYIKERVRECILTEEEASPLSDQQIALQLNSEGILISRRTVTKYREQMNLQSSTRRKNK
ncbi:RNA polymerase factor sigma-54 [Cohnella endophytica]|nr:RNA polymerase factor sigma-54 [Cohnella endophytica]